MGKKKTFYQWCQGKGLLYILDLWDYDLNDQTPNNVYIGDKNKWYYFKCQNHKEHKSELYKINTLVKRYSLLKENFTLPCRQCKSFAQWGINKFGDNFLQLYWDDDKNNDIDPYEIGLSGREKIWIKCQKNKSHGSYNISILDFCAGHRCSCCGKKGKNIPLEESFGYKYPEVLEVWSDKNEFSPYEIRPNSEKFIWLKCKNQIHEDYQKRASAYGDTYHKSKDCPKCKKYNDDSKLQKKVSKYISERYLDYRLVHEYDCTLKPINPKTNKILPFDNEMIDLKLIIEVHGHQHYHIDIFTKMSAKSKNITPEEQLAYQQWKDEFKRNYAIEHGYFYLEIPYWAEDDNSYMSLIDTCIDNIINE